MPAMKLLNAPLVLIVRDGWGQNPHLEHDAFNAVKLARTPVAASLMRDWPWALIKTCGEDVGLPAGTMGNSEVGHQNIGAGRIVDQELMRITRAIRDGSFFTNKALLGAFEHAKESGGAVHIMGLVSDGKVHSDLDHLLAIIDFAARAEFPGERVLIHAFTDGRDVGPTTAPGYVQRLEKAIASRFADAAHRPRIASVIGRYYAMDRDHRWDRVARAYQALTGRGGTGDGEAGALDALQPRLGASRHQSAWVENTSVSEAIQEYYLHPADPSRTGDEFIEPRVIRPPDPRAEPRFISDGDSVIFFNFRGDRPRELTKAFVLDDDAWKNVEGGGFDRGPRISNLHYCTMTGYETGLPVSAIVFNKPPRMPDILAAVLADAGLTQFRCAETEKFPHVTFFFNDYREEPFDGERRLLVPSPRDVGTYDLKPEMSAAGVCEGVLARLAADDCESVIIVNFANADMVGHTGKLPAAIRAVEVVDECVGRICQAVLWRNGSIIVTADHGNAEQMWDPVHNCPHTSHTTYDVPLVVAGRAFKGRALRGDGRLADIAPTMLQMMGLRQPAAMTGRTLLK